MKEKNKELLAEEWFKIGKAEFNYAKSSFEDLDEFYTQICVQCHQAVEKYLKGFLVLNCVDFPYIHNLEKILRLCIKQDSNFKKFMIDVKKISGYYVALRYPVYYKERQKKDAKEAIEIAEKIIKFIDKLK